MKARAAALVLVGLVLVLALALFLGPAEAQPGRTIHRIGYLATGAGPDAQAEAFREGLREHGYVEGQNVLVEYRFAGERFERLNEFSAELARLRVDIIVAVSTQSTLAAKRATQTIPIVFTNVADPVGAGVVLSLARPGGNLTGLAIMTAEMSPKRLELLKEALPEVAAVAALWHPGAHGERTQREMLKETEATARALGIGRFQLIEARSPNDLDGAFAAMVRARVGAVIVMTSPMFFTQRGRIVELAAKHRLPAMHYTRAYVEAGGLMAYGPSFAALARRVGIFVDKILKGAKPADLPVEQPTKFELVINLKTANALGLTIPPSLLLRADQVIE